MAEPTVMRRVKIAGLIWAVSILLSRFIGIAREAVIGRTLGGGAEADVYLTAFVIPDFLNYLLASGALTIVFIPIVSDYLGKGRVNESWESVRVISSFLALLCIIFIAVLWLTLPHLVSIVAPGFDGPQSDKLVAVTRIILPAQFFHLSGGILSAALQARERHKLPAGAPLVYGGCIVAGGLIGGAEAGAYGFAWGVLAGSILGPFGLPFLGCLKAGMKWWYVAVPLVEAGGRYRLSLRRWLTHKDLARYLLLSIPIMLAFSIIMYDDWLIRREATLIGEGAVATLTYSKTLMKVPMGVFGLALGVGAYPVLCKLFAGGRVAEMYHTVTKSVRGVLILALASQAALTVAAFEVAAVIYGRVRLDTAQLLDMRIALAIICLGLPAWAVNSLLARGFFAMKITWIPPLAGSLVTLCAYPLYYYGGREFGTAGLAAASTLAVTLYVLVLAYLLRRSVAKREKPERGEIAFYVKVIAALAPAVAVGMGLDRLLPPATSVQSTWLLLARGAFTGGAAVVVYFGTTVLLKVSETRALLATVARKLRARALLAG